jgi:hypothetical protein
MWIFGSPSKFPNSVEQRVRRAGTKTITIRFETTQAVFSFSLEDAVTVLNSFTSDDDARELIDFLTLQGDEAIEIPQEKKPFLFAVLDLLASNKGSVFCKACGREYQASELESFPIGAGENPLKVKLRYRESLLKRIFGRHKRMPLLEGKGYRCPEGHELVGLVMWRT